MKKSTSAKIILALILIGGGFTCVFYYSYVFAKTVRGTIAKVERVNQNTLFSSANTPDSHIFSYAVSVRDDKGEFHTSSSEDRQWAVAQVGQCVEAKFFPYPPWELDRSGTYYGARLLRLFDCTAGKPNVAPTPQAEAPASH